MVKLARIPSTMREKQAVTINSTRRTVWSTVIVTDVDGVDEVVDEGG